MYMYTTNFYDEQYINNIHYHDINLYCNRNTKILIS